MANHFAVASNAARSDTAIANANIVPSRIVILDVGILLMANWFAWLAIAMFAQQQALGDIMPATIIGFFGEVSALPHEGALVVGALTLFVSLALMVSLLGHGTWRRYRRVAEDRPGTVSWLRPRG
jgi:uncharacterized membrane protein